MPQGTLTSLSDTVLHQAKVLLVDGYANSSAEVVARARALGVAIVADIEWSVGAATDELLRLVGHLARPTAGQSHTGEDDPTAIIARLWSADRSAVALTRGAEGCYLRQAGDDALWHIPPHPVRAVDTTGAGDCFHGAYAYALAQDRTALDSAVFANAAAAILSPGMAGARRCRTWPRVRPSWQM